MDTTDFRNMNYECYQKLDLTVMITSNKVKFEHPVGA